MAGMTRIIRDLIVNTFEHEKEHGWLHNWLAAFRETLIPELDEKQFADMFAQTLAYGLFAARVNGRMKISPEDGRVQSAEDQSVPSQVVCRDRGCGHARHNRLGRGRRGRSLETRRHG